jgi:hypothetical protein
MLEERLKQQMPSILVERRLKIGLMIVTRREYEAARGPPF